MWEFNVFLNYVLAALVFFVLVTRNVEYAVSYRRVSALPYSLRVDRHKRVEHFSWRVSQTYLAMTPISILDKQTQQKGCAH